MNQPATLPTAQELNLIREDMRDERQFRDLLGSLPGPARAILAEYDRQASEIAAEAMAGLGQKMIDAVKSCLSCASALDTRREKWSELPLDVVQLAACKIKQQCENRGLTTRIYDCSAEYPLHGNELPPLNKLPFAYQAANEQPFYYRYDSDDRSDEVNSQGERMLGGKTIYVLVDLPQK